MKVLIIDDSEYKIISIEKLLQELLHRPQIAVARSFQTGIKKLGLFAPDLVLLDMTLPTSETKDGHLDGRTRIYGGREILAEMELNEQKASVIVVTQFDRFGEPPLSVDRVTLFKQLEEEFPDTVIGGVYYSNVDSYWKSQIAKLISSWRSTK